MDEPSLKKRKIDPDEKEEADPDPVTIFTGVANDYKKVAEGGIDINTPEPVRKMFVELTEKHSESIKDRLRYTTQTEDEREDDYDLPTTIAQKVSGCTGFATFVMAQYIKRKYEYSIDQFSNIFNTYPGSLIYGITQPEIKKQKPTDPEYYMNYTFEKVRLKPGLNLVQVCTQSSLSHLVAFGYYPVHTFLVFKDTNLNQLHLASSWFSGEAKDHHTLPTLKTLTETPITVTLTPDCFTESELPKTESLCLQVLLNNLVTNPRNELNVLVKHFFGSEKYHPEYYVKIDSYLPYFEIPLNLTNIVFLVHQFFQQL